MRFKHSMHDGDVLAWDLVDGDITDFIPTVPRVDKEEEVPAVKCWLHGTAMRVQSADSISTQRVT
jgi:hypothetical protein